MYETVKIVLNCEHGSQWTLYETLEKLTDETISFRDFAGVSALGKPIDLIGNTDAQRDDFYQKAEYLCLVLYDLVRKEGAEK